MASFLSLLLSCFAARLMVEEPAGPAFVILVV